MVKGCDGIVGGSKFESNVDQKKLVKKYDSKFNPIDKGFKIPNI